MRNDDHVTHYQQDSIQFNAGGCCLIEEPADSGGAIGNNDGEDSEEELGQNRPHDNTVAADNCGCRTIGIKTVNDFTGKFPVEIDAEPDRCQQY